MGARLAKTRHGPFPVYWPRTISMKKMGRPAKARMRKYGTCGKQC